MENRTYTLEEFKDLLRFHKKWADNPEEGKRATFILNCDISNMSCKGISFKGGNIRVDVDFSDAIFDVKTETKTLDKHDASTLILRVGGKDIPLTDSMSASFSFCSESENKDNEK